MESSVNAIWSMHYDFRTGYFSSRDFKITIRAYPVQRGTLREALIQLFPEYWESTIYQIELKLGVRNGNPDESWKTTWLDQQMCNRWSEAVSPPFVALSTTIIQSVHWIISFSQLSNHHCILLWAPHLQTVKKTAERKKRSIQGNIERLMRKLEVCTDPVTLSTLQRDHKSILFRRSLNDSAVPALYKTARVTPVHKKGARAVPLNKRPVSLTAVSCRVLERLIGGRITFGHLNFRDQFRPLGWKNLDIKLDHYYNEI